MARAFLLVMDSVGIGGAPDADKFFNGEVPDTGANTFGHIAQARAKAGKPLQVGTLDALGLSASVELASGLKVLGLNAKQTGAWGAATQKSIGKDTPSGHWELAGLPVPWDWHVFPKTDPAFPINIAKAICDIACTDKILGNCHASGMQVLDELGPKHMKTGWPICYTSADSVLQIAAHEDVFGRDRLIKLCEDIAPLLHQMKVGRVIARPFIGDAVNGFERTQFRRDFAIAPPSDTLCDMASAAGHHVEAIGKIGDIFSMRGIDAVYKGRDIELMAHLNDRVDKALDGTFVFGNFVEFDSLYGHRRDVNGYATHLEWFNDALMRVLTRLRVDDLLIVTADHGNDPTWIGTDHTRERVPVLVHGIGNKQLGQVAFVDVGASVADHLNIPYTGEGRSFL